MLRKLEYWVPFSTADREALLSLPHTVKSFEPHHYITRERDKTSHTCVVLSGFAIRHKIVGTGLRQICSIHMKGDLVDLQNSFLGVSDHSVQMLTSGDVALIAHREVERLAEDHPAIGRAMWIDTLVDGSIFREWLANVGRRDGRTRLAHLLCEFALRLEVAGLGQQSDWQLPMTQEQLGDATGMTSVHTNRTIKSLEADGLIERPSPRSIKIRDWKALANAGDFDSNYLHLRPGEPALS